MKLDFDRFVGEVATEFAGRIERERVQTLLTIEDDYDFDSTRASSSRLILRSLKVVGEKSDGDAIEFEHQFESGLNMLIADNLKGKSSVFKIIKYALTGRNSIKNDVKKWLNRVLLNFDIDDDQYAIYLNMEGSRLSARLVSGRGGSITKFDEAAYDVVLSANSESKFQEGMQDFFFEKFGYYSLQWTQKDSRKDSLQLNRAGITWPTIFKSIYLESKDSSSLIFGDQGTKIFQVLLGLDLTFPINRLSVKKDFLIHELAKARSSIAGVNRPSAEKQHLYDQLAAIEEQIRGIEHESSKKSDAVEQYKQYDNLIAELSLTNAKIVASSDRFRQLFKKKSEIQKSISESKEEASVTQRESTKASREILRLGEFLESGRFFSNLDIKRCPSCDQGVVHQRDPHSLNNECILCHKSVEVEDEFDDSLYRSKLEELETAVSELEVRKAELAKFEATLNDELEGVNKQIRAIEAEQSIFEDVEPLKKQLAEVQAKINEQKQTAQLVGTELEKLTSERAVLQYRLGQIDDNAPDDTSELLDIDLQVLEFAISLLQSKRLETVEAILRELEQLMLAEIRQLGLISITEVRIDETFNIEYKQDGSYISFESVAEGEKLRAKLALYLSVIQLEIEHNVGRHVRFLIIDSPAKEEGDSQYLKGLSEVLRNIEDRLGNKLQIVIGTAERALAGVAKHERAFPESKFVF